MDASEILVFAGSGSPRLTARICAYLAISPARGEVIRFSEGNLFVRILDNVRGRRTYVVQTIAYPANDTFVELLFWIDALKRASAESVTAIVPYFSYAKGDKKDEPRVSIRARVCADAMQAAGVDRIVTMDLHAAQIQGFFTRPVDDLYALPVLRTAIRQAELENLIVVAPDTGFAKKARAYARYLGAPLAIADKERPRHDERAEVMEVIGEVEGRTALIVDDFSISAGTLTEVAQAVVNRGARAAYAAITHAAFSDGAAERIDASPLVRVLATDTVETRPAPLSAKVEIVTVAELFGEAIRRIHNRESISVLFP